MALCQKSGCFTSDFSVKCRFSSQLREVCGEVPNEKTCLDCALDGLETENDFVYTVSRAIFKSIFLRQIASLKHMDTLS
jgi:hypothetical protein